MKCKEAEVIICMVFLFRVYIRECTTSEILDTYYSYCQRRVRQTGEAKAGTSMQESHMTKPQLLIEMQRDKSLLILYRVVNPFHMKSWSDTEWKFYDSAVIAEDFMGRNLVLSTLRDELWPCRDFYWQIEDFNSENRRFVISSNNWKSFVKFGICNWFESDQRPWYLQSFGHAMTSSRRIKFVNFQSELAIIIDSHCHLRSVIFHPLTLMFKTCVKLQTVATISCRSHASHDHSIKLQLCNTTIACQSCRKKNILKWIYNKIRRQQRGDRQLVASHNRSRFRMRLIRAGWCVIVIRRSARPWNSQEAKGLRENSTSRAAFFLQTNCALPQCISERLDTHHPPRPTKTLASLRKR